MTHFACATVDLEKVRHGTLVTEINNAIDKGPLLLAATAPDANDATLRLKLHVQFVVHLFQT